MTSNNFCFAKIWGWAILPLSPLDFAFYFFFVENNGRIFNFKMRMIAKRVIVKLKIREERIVVGQSTTIVMV